jgi:hypothetical protein
VGSTTSSVAGVQATQTAESPAQSVAESAMTPTH